MPFDPDQLAAGQVLGAKVLNGFFAELERLGKVTAQSPLTLADDASGMRIGVDLGERWWVKLTGGGTGGKYAWTRQQPVAGGTWEDHAGGRTGTAADDPAVETTGKDDVATGDTAIFPAWRDPVSLALLFTAGTCS